MLLNLQFSAIEDMEETDRLLIRCDEYDERNEMKQQFASFTASQITNATNQVKADDNNNDDNTESLAIIIK